MIPNGWQPSDPDVARLRDRTLAEFAAAGRRMDGLEGRIAAWETQQDQEKTEHQTRRWQIALAILGGLVLPLAVIGIVAVLHLG